MVPHITQGPPLATLSNSPERQNLPPLDQERLDKSSTPKRISRNRIAATAIGCLLAIFCAMPNETDAKPDDPNAKEKTSE